MDQARNWFCAQMGGREHYAIPRALYGAGVLGGFMTDYWSGLATRMLANCMPNKTTRSLAAKFHADLPDEIVESWNMRALAWEAQSRYISLNDSVVDRYLNYCNVGKRFAYRVSHSMCERSSLPENSVFFGYDTCSLEAMDQLKERGVACILDQIDPCQVEIEMVQEEQQVWPEWENYTLEVPDEFYERHIQEWNIADRVVVNSSFSRDALIKQGVPERKIVVIPLSYEQCDSSEGGSLEVRNFQQLRLRQGFSHKRPLRVLFLGQVMLRKGIQYLAHAAKLLQDYPVIFDIVGPLNISEKAVKSAPKNMIFHGRTTRDEISNWYRSAHVFILPTLSDGFAITQLEAMANGLPVITTPNCGTVVTEAVDGFLVPPRDPEAIARVVHRYLADPECLESHRLAALKKSKQFTLERVGTALLALGQEIYGQPDLLETHA